MHKVFVYGSLLSGMGNNALLKDAKFLGKATTTPGFQMLDIGWFPGVVEDPSGITIHGEVYEVSDETLARLDRLEGFRVCDPENGLYNRKNIETSFGEAIIYIYNNHLGRDKNFVTSGNWRLYYNRKTGISIT